MSLTALALTQAVKARALEVGFDRVAVGPAGPAEHAGRFEAWLDAGYAGGMDYLVRTRVERQDPARLLPGCRSVVTLALAYGPRDDDPGWSGVSCYARGADYHDLMRPRLAAVVSSLREAGGPEVASRAAVDTSAVLERDLAARAGLGWIGKNTNLIAVGAGSYFFIGIVLTTAALVTDGPAADHCGTCTACLDACPTGAFVGPRVLDARRCLAYLTIEHRGDVPDEWKPAMGDWLFGCDVCQEVCPWNHKAPPAREPALAPTASPPSLTALLEMDDAAFRARFRGSAMRRARRAGLARNAALMLGHRGDHAAAPALRRALQDPDEGVRRAAAWALAQRAPDSEAARPAARYPGRMRVRRLDHFGVDVADLARAERFYTDVLGMSVAMRLPDQVLMRYGDGACALFLKADRAPGSIEQIASPLGKSHHAFEVAWGDYRAAQALFAERGIPHHAPIDWGDHECLYFLDPDGNLLELVGYRQGRSDAP